MKSVEEGVKMNQKELVMKEVVDQEEDCEFNEKQEKVIAIIEAYNSGDKELRDWAMTEMLQETQGFIGKIINKHFYNYKKDYYQEMYQAGALAVFENMGKYDVNRGTLTTYFTSYILHEITEFISRETSHSTPYYANMMSQIKEAIKYFESKHKVPSETDIALYTNLSLRNVQEGLNRIHALDEFRYDYDSELERQLAEENCNSGFDLPENRVIQDELSEVLYEALNNLCEEDRMVILLRLGVVDGNEKSYNSISRELNMPVNVVMQRYTRGIRALQNYPALRNLVNPSLKREQQKILNNPLSLTPTKDIFTFYAELDNEDEDIRIDIVPKTTNNKNQLLITF